MFALGTPYPGRPFAIAPTQAALNGVRVLVIARRTETRTPAQVAEALDDVSHSVAIRARRHHERGDCYRCKGYHHTHAALRLVALAMVIAFANLAGR